jgi:hypothetical protein
LEPKPNLSLHSYFKEENPKKIEIQRIELIAMLQPWKNNPTGSKK